MSYSGTFERSTFDRLLRGSQVPCDLDLLSPIRLFPLYYTAASGSRIRRCTGPLAPSS
jgi:hypothetical protein